MKKIALAQLTSTEDIDNNLNAALPLIEQAAGQGAALIAFPENVLYLDSSDRNHEIASSIPGESTEVFQEQAKKHGLSILIGSIVEKSDSFSDRFYNTSVLIDDQGEITARYRKIHLFDVELPEITLQESKQIIRGEKAVVCQNKIGKIGLTICYDLRFPGLFQQLVEKGAEIIFCPAAFTLQTGKDHWIPLLRARAIENQVYIAAPAQYGRHSKSRISYGSSVIIDPWGTVLSRASEKTGLIFGEIDLDYLRQVRREMPVQNHKVKSIDI